MRRNSPLEPNHVMAGVGRKMVRLIQDRKSDIIHCTDRRGVPIHVAMY